MGARANGDNQDRNVKLSGTPGTGAPSQVPGLTERTETVHERMRTVPAKAMKRV
jgi:hypothetical protein